MYFAWSQNNVCLGVHIRRWLFALWILGRCISYIGTYIYALGCWCQNSVAFKGLKKIPEMLGIESKCPAEHLKAVQHSRIRLQYFIEDWPCYWKEKYPKITDYVNTNFQPDGFWNENSLQFVFSHLSISKFPLNPFMAEAVII